MKVEVVGNDDEYFKLQSYSLDSDKLFVFEAEYVTIADTSPKIVEEEPIPDAVPQPQGMNWFKGTKWGY